MYGTVIDILVIVIIMWEVYNLYNIYIDRKELNNCKKNQYHLYFKYLMDNPGCYLDNGVIITIQLAMFNKNKNIVYFLETDYTTKYIMNGVCEMQRFLNRHKIFNKNRIFSITNDKVEFTSGSTIYIVRNVSELKKYTPDCIVTQIRVNETTKAELDAILEYKHMLYRTKVLTFSGLPLYGNLHS